MSVLFPGNGVCGSSVRLVRLDSEGRLVYAIERRLVRHGKEYWQFRCDHCHGLNTWPKSLIKHPWGGDRRDCHLPEPTVEELEQLGASQ